jgi:hypothetical protein
MRVDRSLPAPSDGAPDLRAHYQFPNIIPDITRRLASNGHFIIGVGNGNSGTI